MARVQAGDAPAFDELFDGLWPILHAYTRARLGASADAEDAAQTTLVRLFEQAPSYELGRPVVGWALCLAHFECLSARKSRVRSDARLTTLETKEVSDGGRSPEELTSEREHRLALDAALEGFSPDERAVLLGEAEVPESETARAALRKRKQRLRARLGDALKKLLGKDDE